MYVLWKVEKRVQDKGNTTWTLLALKAHAREKANWPNRESRKACKGKEILHEPSSFLKRMQ